MYKLFIFNGSGLYMDKYRRQKEYYKRNKMRLREYQRLWRKKHHKRHLKYNKTYREKNRLKLNRNKREYYREGREKIFTILGKRCALCGYDKNILGLEIDHINGLIREYGLKHRRSRFSEYMWYLKHEKLIKKDLQILCGTCHRIKTLTS